MGIIAEIGVLYWKLNAKDHENDPELNKIRQERGYNYMVSFQFYPNKRKKEIISCILCNNLGLINAES